MPSIISQIETLLFVAPRPMSVKEIAKNIGVSAEKAASAVFAIKEKYNVPESGIHIIDNGADMQMAANPENFELAEKIAAREISGELTRAQLETLTVVAYLGPVTRPELEQIRGVNCSIILRNLRMRGLVDEDESSSAIVPSYRISTSALRFLGIKIPSDLPDYNELREHPHIKRQLSTEAENNV